MALCCGPISTATDFLTLVKAKPHVVALAAGLLLGGGLRRTGLPRGIGDFDPSGRSGQTHFYHFHPDAETLIRHVRSANRQGYPWRLSLRDRCLRLRHRDVSPPKAAP